MVRKWLSAATLLLATLPMAASATIVISGSGLTGSFTTENFDTNAGDGTAAGAQFAGITFGSGNFISNSYSGAHPNMTNSVIANFYPCCQDPTSFSFGSDLSELAIAFVSNLQSTTFAAYLNGVLVESQTLATGFSGDYVAFTGMTFDEIRITSVGSNDAYILDDMQMKAGQQVPEPATFGLALLALAGLGWSRRRQV